MKKGDLLLALLLAKALKQVASVGNLEEEAVMMLFMILMELAQLRYFGMHFTKSLLQVTFGLHLASGLFFRVLDPLPHGCKPRCLFCKGRFILCPKSRSLGLRLFQIQLTGFGALLGSCLEEGLGQNFISEKGGFDLRFLSFGSELLRKGLLLVERCH
mmetsp:Transcript_54697/g.127584  ORF Transcript_54697/g.127584 Transcript_54697/m.127584 type:complete len:158 (+) Transcript_54697:381-854(+)